MSSDWYTRDHDPQVLGDPSDYVNQPVCPRCGQDRSGTQWPVCAGSAYSHEESCARYRWHDGLCPACETELMAERDAS